MKRIGSWLWGVVLVAVGVILGLNALGWADIDIFFPGWWTLFIIVPCAIGLITDDHKTASLIGLLIGVCLLLGSLGVLSFDIVAKLFFPVILVIIGLSLIFKGIFGNKVAKKIKHLYKEGVVVEEKEEYWATFGEQNVDFMGKEFSGGKMDAVFGGLDVDLRGAKITDEALLKVTSIFGGIVVYVPEDVEVELAPTSIFGGVTDNRKNNARKARTKDYRKVDEVDNSGKTLYIEAISVFGGVEIR